MPELTLEDRVAIVTGGANGIGRATAMLLAEQGAKVTVGDLHPLPENEQPFAELGIVQQTLDVRSESSIRQFVEGVVEQHGRVDIVVNNAGVGMVKQITEVTEADYDLCLETNLKGPFFVAKYAIAQMQKTGGGVIVNTASNAGLLPRAHDPVYSISKQALIGLTKSLALCHAKDKIRVNAVCPGPVGETGMMNDDIERSADPETLIQGMIGASPLAAAPARMQNPQDCAGHFLLGFRRG
jgi:NAD(P)-dependent dehydrogenase (short-subunit alcohol dehydrogenase family)